MLKERGLWKVEGSVDRIENNISSQKFKVLLYIIMVGMIGGIELEGHRCFNFSLLNSKNRMLFKINAFLQLNF